MAWHADREKLKRKKCRDGRTSSEIRQSKSEQWVVKRAFPSFKFTCYSPHIGACIEEIEELWTLLVACKFIYGI